MAFLLLRGPQKLDIPGAADRSQNSGPVDEHFSVGRNLELDDSVTSVHYYSSEGFFPGSQIVAMIIDEREFTLYTGYFDVQKGNFGTKQSKPINPESFQDVLDIINA